MNQLTQNSGCVAIRMFTSDSPMPSLTEQILSPGITRERRGESPKAGSERDRLSDGRVSRAILPRYSEPWWEVLGGAELRRAFAHDLDRFVEVDGLHQEPSRAEVSSRVEL